MEYQREIRWVVEANIEEVRGDLDQARHALQRTQLEVGRLERTIASLEILLELASAVTTNDHRVGHSARG